MPAQIQLNDVLGINDTLTTQWVTQTESTLAPSSSRPHLRHAGSQRPGGLTAISQVKEVKALIENERGTVSGSQKSVSIITAEEAVGGCGKIVR